MLKIHAGTQVPPGIFVMSAASLAATSVACGASTISEAFSGSKELRNAATVPGIPGGTENRERKRP
jgi:hypothetical protein